MTKLSTIIFHTPFNNRPENYLRALAFNFIDLDNRKVFKDKKKLQVIKELRKDAVILKPDKGNGVVVIDSTDYYESLNKLFSDKTKFKRLDTDPTNTELNILQLTFERHIIETKFQKKSIRKSDQKMQIGWLLKVHKSFEGVPSFPLIRDTIGSTHCNVGKYGGKLLNPVTQNEYSLKDTFDATESIKKIQKELLRNEVYILISLADM